MHHIETTDQKSDLHRQTPYAHDQTAASVEAPSEPPAPQGSLRCGGSGSTGTLASRIKTLASLNMPDDRITGALDDLTAGAILRWYDAGCGSGGHLAEVLGLPPSRNIRALANILTCAKDSPEVRRLLAELSE